MNVMNKKTDQILNILRMHIQPVPSIDDRNMFAQPNKVVPDHPPGYQATSHVYVTQSFGATYPPQTTRQRLHPRATEANVVPLGLRRDSEPRVEARTDVERPAYNPLFEEQTYVHTYISQMGNNIRPNANTGPINMGLENNPNIYVDQVVEIVRNICGPNMRFFIRLTYRKPYSEQIDLTYEFPKGFNVGLLRGRRTEHIGGLLSNVVNWVMMFI